MSEKIAGFLIWAVGFISSGSRDTTFTVLIFLRKKKVFIKHSTYKEALICTEYDFPSWQEA